MTDSLRTRIAAVLDRHKTDPYDEWTCQCSNSGTRWSEHVADAVIAELGLHREELSEVGSSVLFDDPRPHHRYVTDWKADDE